MTAITGGASSVVPTESTYLDALGSGPASTEQRIADALLVCMGRWGLAKTTVEDIAREAGVSRATVYRLYPGGKSAISAAAAVGDVRRLVGLLHAGVDGIDDREDMLSLALQLAATFFAEHQGINFLRQHEPTEFERLVRLDRLDSLLTVAGELVGPVLSPVFDDDDAAIAAAVWLGRLVASHVVNPSTTLDLTDPVQARQVVVTFVLPGLEPVTDRSTHPRPSTH